MQTTCPECGTTFRVSQEQLGLRRGLVRCGHCHAVFNAYDTLLPELSAPELETTGPKQEEGQETPAAAVAPTAPSPDLWAQVQAELDLPSDLPAVPPRDALAVYAQTAALPPEGPDQDGLAAPAAAPAPDSPEAILLSELPRREAAGPGLPGWKTALYVFLILTLTITLLGQLAFFFRGELAAAIPATRPLLTALCQPLGCQVPLPRQLTRQAIVSSSLEHDAEQKSHIRLTILLANRTHQTQAWPHILLTLSDVQEHPVARKLFSPQDYLPRDKSARAGFPPQSEQEVRMELDIGNLAAASYVLDLVYP
jgi:predicted Zn finger-like uncharacterized protein